MDIENFEFCDSKGQQTATTSAPVAVSQPDTTDEPAF